MPNFLDEAKELASSKRAYRHDEAATPNLLRQAQKRSLIEFLRAMNGEAPRRSAKGMHQHRDFGRIGAEVRVKMPDTGLAQPKCDATRFGEVHKVDRQRPFRAFRHKPNQPQCP